MSWLQSRNFEVQTITIIILPQQHRNELPHMHILVCRGLPWFAIQQHKDITQWSSRLILCPTFLISLNTYSPRLELSEGHHAPPIAGQVASQRCSVLMGAFVPAPAHHQLKKHQLVAENLKRNSGKSLRIILARKKESNNWQSKWQHVPTQLTRWKMPDNSYSPNDLSAGHVLWSWLTCFRMPPRHDTAGCQRHQAHMFQWRHPSTWISCQQDRSATLQLLQLDSKIHVNIFQQNAFPTRPMPLLLGPVPGCQETVHGCKPGVLLAYLGGCQVGMWWQNFDQKWFSVFQI